MCLFRTHVYTIHIDGDVSDGDVILVASELHLQHALKPPTHEGDVRNPWGHWGVKNKPRFTHHILTSIFILPTQAPQLNSSPHQATCSLGWWQSLQSNRKPWTTSCPWRLRSAGWAAQQPQTEPWLGCSTLSATPAGSWGGNALEPHWAQQANRWVGRTPRWTHSALVALPGPECGENGSQSWASQEWCGSMERGCPLLETEEAYLSKEVGGDGVHAILQLMVQHGSLSVTCGENYSAQTWLKGKTQHSNITFKHQK